MTPPSATSTDVQAFIARWKESAAAERANFQMFAAELCDVLGVDRPLPSDGGLGDYVFERKVTFRHPDGSASDGRIDLYKRNTFVMEAKQGIDAADARQDSLFGPAPATKARARGHGIRGSLTWSQAMDAARNQAERYAKALPAEEGWPPFVVVADVGHSIALWADFSGSGKAYVPFPDNKTHRIALDALAQDDTRETLRNVWTDPLALDPARKSARVTREVASRLAQLARSLEAAGHSPERVAQFLMRALFTMFAEDVRLLPEGSFTGLLHELKDSPATFAPMMEALWKTMDTGGFSPVLRETLRRFNGSLFREQTALPLDAAQLALLAEAAEFQWQDVEPAIFGTLLERALDPRERHKLGAHYTPRAYVERLVIPTVIEPLRTDWDAAKATAAQQQLEGKNGDALKTLRDFHRLLCETRVLDPACGSGNFLYVTMEHMKRLEGEVLQLLEDMGDRELHLELQDRTVDPHQFLGIEINPRAAAIADVVLWIGQLQWHFRTRGKAAIVPDPVLKKYDNIECRDAVLKWDAVEIVRDEQGAPVTRWDGVTTKLHPVTGLPVPDESARMELYI